MHLSLTQVDVSNVYGKDKEAENRLRSFSGGKFRMQVSAREHSYCIMNCLHSTWASCLELWVKPRLLVKTCSISGSDLVTGKTFSATI